MKVQRDSLHIDLNKVISIYTDNFYPAVHQDSKVFSYSVQPYEICGIMITKRPSSCSKPKARNGLEKIGYIRECVNSMGATVIRTLREVPASFLSRDKILDVLNDTDILNTSIWSVFYDRKV